MAILRIAGPAFGTPLLAAVVRRGTSRVFRRARPQRTGACVCLFEEEPEIGGQADYTRAIKIGPRALRPWASPLLMPRSNYFCCCVASPPPCRFLRRSLRLVRRFLRRLVLECLVLECLVLECLVLEWSSVLGPQLPTLLAPRAVMRSLTQPPILEGKMLPGARSFFHPCDNLQDSDPPRATRIRGS
jgi:hypothetical protein